MSSAGLIFEIVAILSELITRKVWSKERKLRLLRTTNFRFSTTWGHQSISPCLHPHKLKLKALEKKYCLASTSQLLSHELSEKFNCCDTRCNNPSPCWRSYSLHHKISQAPYLRVMLCRLSAGSALIGWNAGDQRTRLRRRISEVVFSCLIKWLCSAPSLEWRTTTRTNQTRLLIICGWKIWTTLTAK